jgi:MFS transporter, PAT family, beta-lactamase induction signal transducer AmpG
MTVSENLRNLRAAVFNRRMLICVFTGFSSGLPFFVVNQMVPAWLWDHGIKVKTIALFSLLGLPYVFKFLWAPLLDYYALPLLGRRRGWMLLTQLGLIVAIGCIGGFDPTQTLGLIAALILLATLFSASQDIVLDAYRRELLPDAELGLGSAIHIYAYRIAGLVPGSLALILSDHLPWAEVFWIVAAFMLAGVALSFSIAELNTATPARRGLAAAIVEPFRELAERLGWRELGVLIVFMVLYKLGDNMATALSTNFYQQLGFTNTQIGVVAKNAALWPSVIGGLVGGLLMVRLGINRALWLFGAFQILCILGFAVLAQSGPKVSVMAVVVALEYLSVGMSTVAFTAFIARTSSRQYAATQFALLTALAAVPRTFASAASGVVIDVFGWTQFFLLCAMISVPGLLLLQKVAPWRAADPV